MARRPPATLEERQRLAAEMHDGLAQTLNYMRLMTELAKLQIEADQLDRAQDTLQRIQAALNQSESEVRQSIASLQETFPPYYTLQEQLASLAEQFTPGEVSITWETTVNVPWSFPVSRLSRVLRVIRALLNACQHAQANHILLRLEQPGNYIRLTVEDDGTGFEVNHLPEDNGSGNGRGDERDQRRGHFGVKIMRARAARIGGELEIVSAPKQGTRLTLTWPIVAGNPPEPPHPISAAVQVN
jgi:signal transduction histidine kinase